MALCSASERTVEAVAWVRAQDNFPTCGTITFILILLQKLQCGPLLLLLCVKVSMHSPTSLYCSGLDIKLTTMQYHTGQYLKGTYCMTHFTLF